MDKMKKQSEKTPFISVVMPAYNVEKYVEEAVCSILDATSSLLLWMTDLRIVLGKYYVHSPIPAFPYCSMIKMKETTQREIEDVVWQEENTLP